MKVNVKRIMALMLVVCLFASLTTAAFAETKKFDSYLMIGDSISVYCGVPSSADYSSIYSIYKRNPNQAFPGTYSELLKKDLGISNICTCAHPGWRSQEALLALGGPDYTSDYMLAYGGDSIQRISGFSEVYANALKNADLISINLGSNDILQAFVYGLYTAFEKEGIAFEGSEQDKQAIEYLNRLKNNVNDTEAMVSLISILETTTRGTVLLKNAIKMIPEAIKGFEKSWNELISLIYEKNPDVNVLVLGLYNPVGELVNYTVDSKLSPSETGKKISNATAWMLEQAAAPVINAMNLYLRSNCRYSNRYVFVDVKDADLTGTKDGVHLGSVGHQYFCSQMKTAINNNFIADSVPATKTTSLLGRLFNSLVKK